jgi:hypothetical protein
LRVREDLGLGVSVTTGAAYDCFGRTILLRERRFVPFDENLTPMFLVLRYREPDSQAATDLVGACFPNGTRVTARDVELFWLPAEDFSVQEGVRLAKTKVKDGAVSLDDFTRRHSTALSRPRIATGATIPGATTWEVWDVRGTGEQELEGGVFGVQVRIDTSSAGFTTGPRYFASLQRSLLVQDEEKNPTVMGLHLDHIDGVAIDGFVFRFLIKVLKLSGEEAEPERDIREFLQQQKAYVSWLGIEPVRND